MSQPRLEEHLLFNLVYASTVSDGVSSADIDDIIMLPIVTIHWWALPGFWF